MGTGKTSWAIQNLFNEEETRSILYIAPTLDEDSRIAKASNRRFFEPQNMGSGKISNIAKLLESGADIASTHELFRRFDTKCRNALQNNKYVLVLDETITAVEPYHFTGKDDYLYLLGNHDIEVNPDGLIQWIGSDLDTRFDDVRILAKNNCLFRVDDKFFLWHYPADIFSLFDEVYILTYMFDGSLMKSYFDLYKIDYIKKSITEINGEYFLSNYSEADKSQYKRRIRIYEGVLNNKLGNKDNILSATWCRSKYHEAELKKLKDCLYNYKRNIIHATGNEILWTCYKDCKKDLAGKGYTKQFLPCNARATNDYKDATCLMYAANYYVNPEILKFFTQHGIEIDQNAIALSTILQWIWRSNIRVKDSEKIINIYIPAPRMRRLVQAWLDS